MIYIVIRFGEEVVGVFDDGNSALDYAKELNAEEGYFFDEQFLPDYAYTVEGHELNNPDGATHAFEAEDMLLREYDYEAQN